ncbi:MAG: arsenate reductase (glutaredoxin) [Dokdonella sp.]
MPANYAGVTVAYSIRWRLVLDNVIILHNPRCTKSRATLALLEARGLQPRIVDYLTHPPTAAELREILGKLGFRARELVRKEEAEYQDLQLDAEDIDDDALIAAMHAHPHLIQRPIVLANGKAAIGRPPEAILDIL